MRKQWSRTTLRLSPLAWCHWQFLAHAGETEAAAFGITSPDDPLKVERLWVPKQECTWAFCETAEGQFNEMVEWAFDAGVAPSRVGKIWFHTHPGTSPNPSGTDENTFEDDFGKCELSVMAILARGGDTYARVQFKAGPQFVIPVEVEWDELDTDELAAAMVGWKEEYAAKVTKAPERIYVPSTQVTHLPWDFNDPVDRALAKEAAKEAAEEAKENEERFEEWLYERYEVTPTQLDKTTLDALEQEFFEEEGIELLGPDELNKAADKHWVDIDQERYWE